MTKKKNLQNPDVANKFLIFTSSMFPEYGITRNIIIIIDKVCSLISLPIIKMFVGWEVVWAYTHNYCLPLKEKDNNE